MCSELGCFSPEAVAAGTDELQGTEGLKSLEIRDVKLLLHLYMQHSGASLIKMCTSMLNPPEALLLTALVMCWGCLITKQLFILPVHSSAGCFGASTRKGMPVLKEQGLCSLVIHSTYNYSLPAMHGPGACSYCYQLYCI